MTDLGKRAIPKLSENFYVIWMLLGWHTRRHAGGAGKCPNQWGQSIKESAVEVEKALAFPGIILYGVALFALEDFIRSEKERKVYRTLTAFGLTPWIALHLFYIMILYIFSWLSTDSYAEAALPLGEALFAHFSWVPLVSEILMLPPFLYWFYLQIRQNTVFPKGMAFTNIFVIYFLMYGIKSMMPTVRSGLVLQMF